MRLWWLLWERVRDAILVFVANQVRRDCCQSFTLREEGGGKKKKGGRGLEFFFFLCHSNRLISRTLVPPGSCFCRINSHNRGENCWVQLCLTALSRSWQVPPCPAAFSGSCVREELSSLLPLQGARPPTRLVFLLLLDHWCGKLAGQNLFCICDWHLVSDRNARFLSPGSSSEKTSLCLDSLSCFLSLFSFSPLPCCYTSPLSFHPSSHEAPSRTRTFGRGGRGEKNPKFDLRGFIFRDTLSVCITLIRPPPPPCRPAAYLWRDSANSALRQASGATGTTWIPHDITAKWTEKNRARILRSVKQ